MSIIEITEVSRTDWYLLGGITRTGSFRKHRSGKWFYFITHRTFVSA